MKGSKKSSVPVIDPYLPGVGNFGYRASRYELELDYKVPINRLDGSVLITAVTLATLRTFSLDLCAPLRVTRVLVNGKPAKDFRARDNKVHITLAAPLPPGAAMTVAVRYTGAPRPRRTLWGEVGFEELTEGALVAGQPNGASTWFPCDDQPGAKASYRIQVSAESPYRVVSNGALVSTRARSGRTTWTYELAEPTSTYLVTLQIGMYDLVRLAKAPVPISAVLPARLRRNLAVDFSKQPQMMTLFSELFGPYPVSSGYTVVIHDESLEIPLEAQGVSIFGANHCDGTRDSERLVAHELAHQWFGNSVTARHWRDIWLHEGFACYAEWLWSEHAGGMTAAQMAQRYHRRLLEAPADILLADPGPRDMFDDRVYKRGALTLHALRVFLGDETFFALLRDWTTRYRHSTVVTDDFLGLAAKYAPSSLNGLWDAWLFSLPVPDLG
ncbi:hypothetical protein MBRU_14750 [Mycolicibacterium brumae DSM 44177]|nr:hypothetical protein MBRU_14750 [Mycolicibacterium brumae DSM 44177]